MRVSSLVLDELVHHGLDDEDDKESDTDEERAEGEVVGRGDVADGGGSREGTLK